jgi:hypothetical protein
MHLGKRDHMQSYRQAIRFGKHCRLQSEFSLSFVTINQGLDTFCTLYGLGIVCFELSGQPAVNTREPFRKTQNIVDDCVAYLTIHVP